MKKITNMVSSVRNRLLEIARRKNRPFEEILVLYGLERFLFRLSQSAHKDQFILKGGLLIYGMELSPPSPIYLDINVVVFYIVVQLDNNFYLDNNEQ